MEMEIAFSIQLHVAYIQQLSRADNAQALTILRTASNSSTQQPWSSWCHTFGSLRFQIGWNQTPTDTKFHPLSFWQRRHDSIICIQCTTGTTGTIQVLQALHVCTTCILQVLCILPCRHYIHAGTTCTYKYTTGTTGIYYRYYRYYIYYRYIQVLQVLHTNLPSILTPCDRWTTGIGTGFETSTVHGVNCKFMQVGGHGIYILALYRCA